MIDLVIGYGEIGKPLFDILSVKRNVDFLDLEAKVIDDEIEVIHICFPYSEKFNVEVLRYIKRFKPELVIIHSTVLPGSTTKISNMTNVPIAYSPIRGRHTKMHRDMIRYNKFVAGATECALGWALAYFGEIGLFNTEIMMPVESLELAKLIETAYSGLMIAWAQELDRFSGKVGISMSQVLQFTREVEYLPDFEFYPGYIGGHCIMQNIRLLDSMRHSPAVTFIRQSNQLCEEAKKSNTTRHIPKRIERLHNDD